MKNNKFEETGILKSKPFIGYYIWWLIAPFILILNIGFYLLFLHFSEEASKQMLYLQPFSLIMALTFLIIKKDDLSIGSTIFNKNNEQIYKQGFFKKIKYASFSDVVCIKRFTFKRLGMYFWAYKICLKNGEQRIISDLVLAPRFLAYFKNTKISVLKEYFKIID